MDFPFHNLYMFAKKPIYRIKNIKTTTRGGGKIRKMSGKRRKKLCTVYIFVDFIRNYVIISVCIVYLCLFCTNEMDERWVEGLHFSFPFSRFIKHYSRMETLFYICLNIILEIYIHSVCFFLCCHIFVVVGNLQTKFN